MTAITPDLVSVNALEDFKLAVVFSDGKRGVFDCGPYMNFEFMEELRDPEKFAKVFIENGTASWSFDGADLAPDDIYQNCKPYGLLISAEVDEAGRKEGAASNLERP